MTEACNSNVLHRDIIAIVCLVMSGTNGQDATVQRGDFNTKRFTEDLLVG